jgi:thiamine-monophosphate kinase
MGDGRPDEDDLIARFFGPLATSPGALGLKDDAATLAVPAGRELVLTTDSIVAGVHFLPEDSAGAVARKALRVNVSDLVAKGATPAAYLLTLALPEGWTEEWVAAFAEGLAEDQQEYGIALLGGDTVGTPGPLWVSVAAFGFAPAGRVPRRTAARPGQRLYVTGTIGDAALGLRLRRDPRLAERWGLDDAQRAHLLGRYLLPAPRLAAAPLVAAYASASMDVSDGLAIDLSRLCKASEISAVIETGKVPLSAAAAAALAADARLLEPILTGGDDYEVLLAIAASEAAAFEEAAGRAGVPVAEIGATAAAAEPPLRLMGPDGEIRLGRLGFRHF